MKFEVKYMLYKLPEGLRMRKYWHMILGYKRIHKPERTFSGFLQISMDLCGSKVQLTPPDRNFINGITNPEIVY